ncbi:MAG: pentapeptide repeat-containing protein [Candidatus Omnitrophica bacterium]|nr:pentapeptide repeat-containing protein [Candidatus Omnitrophota bacterium]MBU4488865.1 pentapeptide repeat-containing protein [Candidatus Omnitrophota bacterium]MCG2705663.1 pentapeptide repeat-containing protein [Candidatus Omnitrophota bacterium]
MANPNKTISVVGNEIRCTENSCKEKAVSLSRFCWNHTVDKAQYMERLKDFFDGGGDGEGFILRKVIIPNAELMKAKLNNADLSQSDFKNANFFHSDMNNANLIGCNMEGADLTGVNLENSDLTQANLKKTRLWHADLSRANITEAYLEYADLWQCRLYSSRLWHTEITGAKSLTMQNFARSAQGIVTKPTEKIDERGILSSEESYRDLKRYFLANGRYKDASWASFKEKAMEQKWLLKNRSISYIPLALMGILCGYGEKPNRVILSSLAIILLYGLIYFSLQTITPSYADHANFTIGDYIYYSIVTFTTLGYGDMIPKENVWYRLLAGSEAFIGAFMIGLFVFTLSRRYSAR